MKTHLFTIVSLYLFHHAECTGLDANPVQFADRNDPNSQQEADQTIEKLFEKLQAAKREMFDFFFNEEEDFETFRTHILGIHKIAKQIAQLPPTDESNLISRTMKSYINSITKPRGLEPIFFRKKLPKRKIPFFSYAKALLRLKHYLGRFLSIMNSMTEKLHNKRIFDDDLKRGISNTFGIKKSEFDLVDVSRSKEEIIDKVENYRLQNLKFIFQLIHLKLLSKSIATATHQIDSFFNFVLRESIFLDYKFEMVIASTQASTLEMFKPLLLNLEESYNSLFAFFCHSLYLKNNLEEKMNDGGKHFDPIKKLICFFSDAKKMSKYLGVNNALLKYYFSTLIDKIFCDIELLKFLKAENPQENEALESFSMLLNRLNDLFYCINHFKILELPLSANAESLNQNLLMQFAEKISSLIKVLVDDSLSKENLELFLADKIQNVYTISEQESALHLTEILEKVPKVLSRYLKNELTKLFSAISLETYESIDQLKKQLKPKISELCLKQAITYENLHFIKKKYKSKVLPNLKFYLDLFKDFHDLYNFEKALASEYRGLIKDAKSILSEILYFLPTKDDIETISEVYPFQEKLKHIKESKNELRTIIKRLRIREANRLETVIEELEASERSSCVLF